MREQNSFLLQDPTEQRQLLICCAPEDMSTDGKEPAKAEPKNDKAEQTRMFNLLATFDIAAEEEIVFAGFLDDIDPSFILMVSNNKQEQTSYLYLAKINFAKSDQVEEHDEMKH
jgi:hypothetical protein